MALYRSQRDETLKEFLKPTCNLLNKSTNEIDKMGFDEIELALSIHGFSTKKPRYSRWSRGGYSTHSKDIYNVLDERDIRKRRTRVRKKFFR